MNMSTRQRSRIDTLMVISLLVLGLPGLTQAAPGEIDPTFGFRGTVTTNVGVTGSAYAVALQPDGKIVVADVAGGMAHSTGEASP